MFYILVGKKTVKCADLSQWSGDINKRRVAETEKEGYTSEHDVPWP